MKRFYFFVLSFVCLLAGCSKVGLEKDDVAGIFDGSDKDAMIPVSVSAGSAGSGGVEIKRFSVEDFLVLDVLSKSGVQQVDQACRNGAALVNDASLLTEVSFDGTPYNWPELDLEKYSLLVCSYACAQTNLYVYDQRLVSREGQLSLYLEIRELEGTGGFTVPTTKFFAALYPKLPDGQVEVHNWRNKSEFMQEEDL